MSYKLSTDTIDDLTLRLSRIGAIAATFQFMDEKSGLSSPVGLSRHTLSNLAYTIELEVDIVTKALVDADHVPKIAVAS